MKDFKLTLNVNEVNLLMRALGTMPYNQVAELITKIQAQAQEQLAVTNGHEAVLENTRSN